MHLLGHILSGSGFLSLSFFLPPLSLFCLRASLPLCVFLCFSGSPFEVVLCPASLSIIRAPHTLSLSQFPNTLHTHTSIHTHAHTHTHIHTYTHIHTALFARRRFNLQEFWIVELLVRFSRLPEHGDWYDSFTPLSENRSNTLVFEQTPVIHMHVAERLDSTNTKQCTYTGAYLHPHACVYTCICIRIHRHTYIHIHTYAHAHIQAYMHTHIHLFVYAHLYTDRKSQHRRFNASSNIIDVHMYPYRYSWAYIYLCTYTLYVETLQRGFRRCARWCPTNACITYTSAHVLVPRTPDPKCTQHSLQKNAHLYIYTHICIRIHMHTNTHAYRRLCTTHQRVTTETHNLCTNMHTHTYTHV